MEQLKELKKLKDDYINKMKTEGATIIKQISDEVFSAMPEIYAFGWTQYAPYFNDGDPCIFGVNDPVAWFSKESAEDGNFWEGDIEGHILGKYITSNRPKKDDWAYKEQLENIEPDRVIRLKECFDAISGNDDLMEMVFGDSVSVLFTRDSDEAIVEACDHD